MCQRKPRKLHLTRKSRNQETKRQDFKSLEFVSIKIDRVDKASALHPNALLGRVTEVDNTMLK